MSKKRLGCALLSAIMLCGLGASFSTVSKNHVKAASEAWTQTTTSGQLAVKYAKANVENTVGSYVDYEDPDGFYTLGIKRGNVNEMSDFKIVNGDGTSADMCNPNDPQATSSAGNKTASITNWSLYSGGKEGVVIYFTAIKKMSIKVNGVTFGGAPYSAFLSYYIKANETETYVPVLKNKLAKGSYATQSALGKTTLEAGDVFAWEFIYEGTDWRRNIQQSGGIGLPVFVLSEYVPLQTEDIDAETYREGIYLSGTEDYTGTKNLVGMTVKAGLMTDVGYATGPKGALQGDGYTITENGLTINNGKSATIQVVAKDDLNINLDYPAQQNENLEGLKITYIVTNSLTGESKYYLNAVATESLNTTLFGGHIILNTGDTLYIGFTSDGGENKLPKLPTLNISQSSTFDVGDFPKYIQGDHTNDTSIDFKTILLESAKSKCAPIEMKDISLRLVTGLIGPSINTLGVFDYIHYDDGKIIGKADTPESATMYHADDAFGATHGSSVEDYRLAASSTNWVVFEATAKVDTAFHLSHEATNAGWVNGDANYFFAFQNGGSQPIEIMKKRKHITTNVNPADTFAETFHMAEGDVAYYCYGSDGAYNLNLNIKFDISTDENAFDPTIRENDIFDFTSTKSTYHDMVTKTIQNKYKEVNFGLLGVWFAHGTPKNIQPFETHLGDGTGTAEDALINGSEGSHLSKFWRWQTRANADDDAIMKFTAHRNTSFKLTWRREGPICTWGSGLLKFYYIAADGFMMLKETREFSENEHSELEDTYFDVDVSLREGESLIIDYNTDYTSYGVIFYDYSFEAVAADYDEAKTVSFTEARAVKTHIDTRKDELTDYYYSLNEEDYSMLNWAKVEEAYYNFIDNADEFQTVEECDLAYYEAYNAMDAVKTAAEEALELRQAKADGIKECETYLNNAKGNLSISNFKKGQAKLEEVKTSINSQKTVTKVKVQVNMFKAEVNTLLSQGQLPSKFLWLVIVGGVVVAGGIAAAIIIPAVKKKKKGAK